MKKIKGFLAEKLDRFELTPKLLALFCAAAGVFTALMALLAPSKSSFYRLAVSPELWIIFVLVIVYKCKKPVDAAFMTGGMMLAVHFVSTLIQVPFVPNALTGFLKMVLVTAFCVPYAYYAKKALDEGGRFKDWAEILTAALYIIFALVNIKVFVYYLPWRFLAAVICIAVATLFIIDAVHDHTTIVAGACACGAVLLIGAVVVFAHRYNYKCVLLLDARKFPITEKWSAKVEDEHISDAEIESAADDSAVLEMTIYEKGENKVTLTDEDGNEHTFTVSYDEEEGIVIDE